MPETAWPNREARRSRGPRASIGWALSVSRGPAESLRILQGSHDAFAGCPVHRSTCDTQWLRIPSPAPVPPNMDYAPQLAKLQVGVCWFIEVLVRDRAEPSAQCDLAGASRMATTFA